MDLASIIAIAAGSSVLGGAAVAVINGIFGRAQARAGAVETKANAEATYGEMYGKMYADFARLDAARAQRDDARIRELVGAVEKLTDAVDRVTPYLDRLVDQGVHAGEVVELRERTAQLREANSVARRAI